jgi:hypothetical protein
VNLTHNRKSQRRKRKLELWRTSWKGSKRFHFTREDKYELI